MNYLFILFLPLLIISACSDEDDIPVPETSSSETTSTHKAAPKKVSDGNVFKTQLDALDAAKMVSGTAQQSIDDNQQKLQQAGE